MRRFSPRWHAGLSLLAVDGRADMQRQLSEPLTPEGLIEVIPTGVVPPAAVPTILHFLEQAPL